MTTTYTRPEITPLAVEDAPARTRQEVDALPLRVLFTDAAGYLAGMAQAAPMGPLDPTGSVGYGALTARPTEEHPEVDGYGGQHVIGESIVPEYRRLIASVWMAAPFLVELFTEISKDMDTNGTDGGRTLFYEDVLDDGYEQLTVHAADLARQVLYVVHGVDPS